MKLRNTYYILRHGEAVSNVKNIVSCWPEKFKNPLTKNGRAMVRKSAKRLAGKHIDMIFASDLLRARQTAEIAARALKLKPKFDTRLREVGFGKLNNRPITELNSYFKTEKDRIKRSFPGGEIYQDVVKRMTAFLKETDKKYNGKTILIVSHQAPLWMLENKVKGFTLAEGLKRNPEDTRIKKGQVKELTQK